ncbi:MAG TPA: hypothetical protein DDW52_13775 [Planctomycetaceae bacterium]|nr:hypothetical protein [Planctomycetaceae bacterium]
METQKLLHRLAALIEQPRIKLRVEHENLETVYIETTPENEILVHDRGYAHAYLLTDENQVYRDWADLGIEFIRSHCESHRLSLENLHGDQTDEVFCICGRATTDLQIAELVNRVAACQDELFHSAYRPLGE